MKLAETTVEQYRERVELACEFLAGQSKELLAGLEVEMQKAATALDFERAAELRNMLDDLRKTTKPMARYIHGVRGRSSTGSNIDPAADIAALAEALSLGAPLRRMECFDISNISTTHVVASMVCFIDGRPANAEYRRYRIKTVSGQDDFASMAEVVRRRYSRVLLEGREAHAEDAEFSQEDPAEALARHATSAVRLPDLVIVDGGKGQLSAACRELQRLRLHDLPIIGLAKEFEEIHRPGRPLPLRLAHDSGALKLLQRIRDEAHRFANGYHQLLMKRRIAESTLDDCPGVSQNRRTLLLRRFGSVARLKRASIEQIAAVSGIGPKLAEQVVQFLKDRA
jgi:excinuclease ABC subunit C